MVNHYCLRYPDSDLCYSVEVNFGQMLQVYRYSCSHRTICVMVIDFVFAAEQLFVC